SVEVGAAERLFNHQHFRLRSIQYFVRKIDVRIWWCTDKNNIRAVIHGGGTILKDSAAAMNDRADIVFIGTPPDSHINLAHEILDASQPKVLMIEKPLCGPDLNGCEALWHRALRMNVFIGVGYNHSVGRNTILAEQALANGIGRISTISARTREHWGGIFSAHPWLSGPEASYLGFYRRGGGAAGEHSHAIHI